MNEMSPIIGHNNPPEDLKSDLETRYHDSLNQVAELLDVAATVPQELDDFTQPKAAELIKKMRFLETTLDGARKLEKEPFDAKVKLVNGVFNTRVEKLEAARKTLNERSQAYLEKKAAAERRRLQEEEEKRREAQRLAEIEAKAAEDRRLAAEAAERKAKEEAEAAERRKLQAIEDARQAEERAAVAREEEKRMKAEQAIRDKEKAERDAAMEAERAEQKRKHDERMAELKAQREIEEKAAAVAREEAAKALAERREAEEASRVARADVKSATRDGNMHLDHAVREEKRADRIADKVDGPEADLARTRSEHGAVSTLSRKWECRITDVEKLSMAALWPHVSTEEKAIALRKWMLLQPQDRRVMPGAIMEEIAVGQVR